MFLSGDTAEPEPVYREPVHSLFMPLYWKLAGIHLEGSCELILNELETMELNGQDNYFKPASGQIEIKKRNT